MPPGSQIGRADSAQRLGETTVYRTRSKTAEMAEKALSTASRATSRHGTQETWSDSLEHAFNHAEQCALRLRADDRLDRLAVLEQGQRRYGHHLVRHGRRRVGVDVELHD